MFSSKDLISFVFSNENDTYYGDDLLKRDLNQYLWERLHENYEAVYFLSAENSSFRVRSYGDIKCNEYTPKKKKMFGLLSSSSEQSELGNWILRQLRAKSDATAAFVCSIDDFCSVLSNPQWDQILEEISEGSRRTGIFVLTASATAENSATLLLTSPVFDKLHETAVTDLRDGALRDLYSTLKKRKWDNCVFMNSFTWERIHGMLLHLVFENPDRSECCEKLDIMSEYLLACLRDPDFARDEKLFPEGNIDEHTMYEELYVWFKNDRNWKSFTEKVALFEKNEKKRTGVKSSPSDITVLRAPNSYAGRSLKINLPSWLAKDPEAKEQAQSTLNSIHAEVSVPKNKVENKRIIEYAEKLLNQLDTVATGDTESYNFVLNALRFCVDNIYCEKTDCILDLLQKKQEAINIFNQHFVMQQNIAMIQISSAESTLQSGRLQQLKSELYVIEKIKNRYIDLITTMEWDLKTSSSTEYLSKAWETLKAEIEKYKQKPPTTADNTTLPKIENDNTCAPVSEPEPQPEPEPELEPEPEKEEVSGDEVFVLRDSDRASKPRSLNW